MPPKNNYIYLSSMRKSLLIVAICLVFSIFALPPSSAAETTSVKVDATNFPDANFRKYIVNHINDQSNHYWADPYISETNELKLGEVNTLLMNNLSAGDKIASLAGTELFNEFQTLKCDGHHLAAVEFHPSCQIATNKDNSRRNCDLGKQTIDNGEKESINLKEYDRNFNPSRVHDLTGATLTNDGVLTFAEGSISATYYYVPIENAPDFKMQVTITRIIKIPATSDIFPDEKFLDYLKTKLNDDNSGKTPYDAATNTINPHNVRMISCPNLGIKSLKGIEMFPNLGTLYCGDNNLIAFTLHPNAKIGISAFDGQTREVGGEASIDLATLDSAFDPANVTALEGATLKGTTLTFNDHSFLASYTYHPIPTDKGRSMTVEIIRYADGIEVNTTNFPDSEFRRFLQEDQSMKKYYKDGKISLGVNKIEINWQYDKITDLKGIDYFVHLQTLNINDRKVGKSLETVKLPTSLTYLYCSNVAGLTKISNLDELTNLVILNIANNGSLETLDVSKNTKLKKLSCGSDGGAGHSTKLKSLTLPSDPSLLEELDCSRTLLTKFDLTKCTGLKFLKINYARDLEELKLPVGPDGTSNQVQKITCDNCKLLALDLSKCALLRRLECSNNVLTGLDLSACAVLDTLDCGNPLAFSDSEYNNFQDKELDLSHNLTLKWLECMHLNISKLDLSKHSQLEYINCGLNGKDMAGKDEKAFKFTLPTSAPNLIFLNCGTNGLTNELDNIHIYPELRLLECADNKISKLDVTQNTKLHYLYARFNQLTELDVTHNLHLTHLTCSYNPISELDVSNNPLLTSLNCNDSKISILDLSQNTELDTLHVENCQLIALDLTKQKKLFDVKLNNQNRYLGKGRHFNMNRRDGHYSGGNIQDANLVVVSSTFTDYVIDTTQDDANFPEAPSTQSETGDVTEADNSVLTEWMTFDPGQAKATYNYQTGGIYNYKLATQPDLPKSETNKSTAKKSKPMRTQSIPETYEKDGNVDADGDIVKYALMDVTITRGGSVTGVDEVETATTAVRVRAEQGAAVVDGAEGRIAVYTTAGTLAATATATDGFSTRIPLPAGLYMVVTSNSTAKIFVP